MAMQDMNDQVQARLAKLAKFKEMGIEAYPHKFNRTHAAMAACRWFAPATRWARRTTKSSR